MAVTAMWPVKSRLDHVIEYTQDDNKTMQRVYDYVSDDTKINNQFITCINCSNINPYQSMMRTKELFRDKGKRLAYHGYQSFAVGEGTPEMIHEIGVKTVKELFGNKYEVVVTTHLDKDYYHNHFIINSTSMIDGKKFCNTKKDYYNLKNVSDRLCKEYGLSVIENPKYKKRNKTNHQITQSFIREIKQDFDISIKNSFITKQVYDSMKFEGYTFGYVGDVECIKHPYYDKPIPLKMLGKKYSYDSINNRVLKEGSEYAVHYCNYKYNINNEQYIYQLYCQKKLTGIQYTYVKWAVLLGIMPKHHLKPRRLSKETLAALKRIDMYSDSVNLMFKYNLHTLDDISNHQNKLQMEIDTLIKSRKDCYYQRSKCNETIDMNEWSAKAAAYTPRIKELRKEIKTCTFIKERTLKFEKQNQELEQHKNIKRER